MYWGSRWPWRCDYKYAIFVVFFEDLIASLHKSPAKTLLLSLYDSNNEANSLANGEALCRKNIWRISFLLCFIGSFLWLRCLFLWVALSPQDLSYLQFFLRISHSFLCFISSFKKCNFCRKGLMGSKWKFQKKNICLCI